MSLYRAYRTRNKRPRLAIVVAAMAGALNAPWGMAQSTVPRPEFEAASIRLNIDGGPYVFNGQKSPGMFVSQNQTLRNLIQEAYGIPSGKRNWLPVFVAPGDGIPILGGPTWIGFDRWDITAKWRTTPEEYATAASINKTQSAMELMLQSLLEQRFQLRLHRETRERPVYELRIAKAGKLRHGDCTTFDPGGPPSDPASSQQPFNYCGGSGLGRKGLDWTLDGTGMKMADLANTLSFLIGSRTVIDKTGFTGPFDVHLRWTPGFGEFGASNATASRDDAGSSIFSVLQERLGLKLVSARGPVEVLVIDYAEKPLPN